VLAAAHLVVALQTLVSRDTPPMEPSVLTIGSIHGGTAPNIIPTRVELHGTLRAFEPAVRERLLGRVRELVHGVPALWHVQSEIEMTDCCPACVNNDQMAEFVRGVATRVVGAEHVSGDQRTTGADDMSLFLNAVPGAYFLVGSANAERGLDSPHHSPTFDFDERALDGGVSVLTAVALDFLNGE